MSLENPSRTGSNKIEVMRVEDISQEQVDAATATIEADELLSKDSLAAEMIESGFVLKDGTIADPESWINARRSILEAGPTTPEEAIVERNMAVEPTDNIVYGRDEDAREAA